MRTDPTIRMEAIYLFIYSMNFQCTELSRLGRETNVQQRDDAYRVTTQQFELNVKKIIENKSFACLSSARLHNLNFMLELLQCNKGQSWDFFTYMFKLELASSNAD